MVTPRVRKPKSLNHLQKIDRQDDPEQSKAFEAKAREIEADGDDGGADLLMGRLAKMKPEPRKPKATKP